MVIGVGGGCVSPGDVREIGSGELLSHGVHVVDERTTITSTQRTTGPVLLLSMQGAAHELSIDTVTARPDHAVFAFVDAPGLVTKEHNGPWMPVGSGLVMAPSGIAQHVRCAGSWSITAACVPQAALGAFVAALPATAQVLEERRPLDRAMQAFVEQVLAVDDTATAIERYAIERLIVEMSGAILLDRIDGASGHRSPHAALRDKAVAVIAHQCSDPALNPARVAREVRSSLRQLQLVFAEAENSVACEIRRQRARLAKSLLLDSRFDSLSIEQISQRAGFPSPISLRRALEEEYGATPRALRAHREAAQRPQNETADR
ncbi:hypothetical protein GCM10009587_06260 [Microbacterium maritypicum]